MTVHAPIADSAPPPEEERRSELVGSFGKGLMVIRALADASTGMTLSEVADATNTTRASARRYLMTLIELGYAEQIDKRFELTPDVTKLVGNRYDAGLTWKMAEPLMRRLAQTLGESCTAAVRDRTEVVCVAHVEAPKLMAFRIGIGDRLPALHTALGRAVLLELSPSCLDDVIATSALARHTPFTLTERADIHRAMADAKAHGYAIVDQELELGLRSLAVPVRNEAGRIFAALNISAQSSRVECRQMSEDFLPPLLEAAQSLSHLNRNAG